MFRSPTHSFIAVIVTSLCCQSGVSNGEEFTTLSSKAPRWYHRITYSPDGQFLAGAGELDKNKQGHVTVWNLRTGDLSFHKLEFPVQCGHLDFSPDGSLLAVSCGDLRKHVSLFSNELIERRRVWSLIGAFPRSPSRTIITDGVDFSPDGTSLAQLANYYGPGSREKSGLRILQAGSKSWQPSLMIPMEGGFLGECRFIEDNRLIVTQSPSDSPFPRLNIVDLKTATVERQIEIEFASGGFVPCLDVSVDRRLIAVGGEGFLSLFDAESFDVRQQFPVGSDCHVRGVSLSPDAALLAITASLGTTREVMQLWNTATGGRLCEREVGRSTAIAFSPDGTSIASAGSLEPKLRIWEVAQLVP